MATQSDCKSSEKRGSSKRCCLLLFVVCAFLLLLILITQRSGNRTAAADATTATPATAVQWHKSKTRLTPTTTPTTTAKTTMKSTTDQIESTTRSKRIGLPSLRDTKAALVLHEVRLNITAIIDMDNRICFFTQLDTERWSGTIGNLTRLAASSETSNETTGESESEHLTQFNLTNIPEVYRVKRPLTIAEIERFGGTMIGNICTKLANYLLAAKEETELIEFGELENLMFIDETSLNRFAIVNLNESKCFIEVLQPSVSPPGRPRSIRANEQRTNQSEDAEIEPISLIGPLTAAEALELFAGSTMISEICENKTIFQIVASDDSYFGDRMNETSQAAFDGRNKTEASAMASTGGNNFSTDRAADVAGQDDDLRTPRDSHAGANENERSNASAEINDDDYNYT